MALDRSENLGELSGRRAGYGHLLGFDAADFLHPPHMAAPAETGLQKNLNDLADLIFAEQIGPKAQHIAVMVFARPPGRHFIVCKRRTDAFDLVGGNRHADSAAVHQDADVGFGGRYGSGDERRKVRVIAG